MESNSINIGREQRKLKATLNIYRGFKERYEWLLKDNNQDIVTNTKLFKKYSDLEQLTNKELYSLEQSSIYRIDKYLEIMRIKDLANQTDLTKRLVYILLFEKIIYEPLGSDKFRIILYPFTFLSELL
ncbi:MAG: hypothetical protein WCL18_03510 [bacterium]